MAIRSVSAGRHVVECIDLQNVDVVEPSAAMSKRAGM